MLNKLEDRLMPNSLTLTMYKMATLGSILNIKRNTMRNILLGVLLLPALAMAEPVKVDKVIVCDNASEMLPFIAEKYGEKPIWFGNSNDSKFTITMNEETQTWSIIQFSTEKNIACLIDSGEGFKFKMPGVSI